MITRSLGEMSLYKVDIYQRALTRSDPFQIVRVGPQFRGNGNAMEYWVGMNVTAKMAEVFISGDLNCLIAVFKKCAALAVCVVECLAVTAKDASRQIAGGNIANLTDEPMIMIGEKTIGDDGNVGFVGDLF